MVGKRSLWKLETECPAQGHLHSKYFKTFYWPRHGGYMAPAMQVGEAQADHARPP